jgi:hypothetical protein
VPVCSLLLPFITQYSGRYELCHALPFQEGDGSHLLGTAGVEDLVRVSLGRLDLDTVRGFDREERKQDKESTKK